MQRCRPLLGTYVEISIDAPASATRLNHAFEQAFARIQQIHALLSFHDPNSELTRINREALNNPVQVHPLTYQLLEQSADLFERTEGAFDCSIGPSLLERGFLPWPSFVTREWYDALRSTHADQRALVLQPPNTVRFTQPLLLDLGGIAKGFAIDQACEGLLASGIRSACVNAGGDLRVLGEGSRDIFVRHPTNPARLLPLGTLANGAVATSAKYFSTTWATKTKGCALISPQSGASLEEDASYTVIAPTCTTADALTKALAVHKNVGAAYFEHYQAQAILLDSLSHPAPRVVI